MKLYDSYKKHLSQIKDISSTIRLMEWDMHTKMPDLGMAFRKQQIGTLESIRHDLFLDYKFHAILNKLGKTKLSEVQIRNLEKTFEDVDKHKKYKSNFIKEFSIVKNQTFSDRKEARKNNDFDIVKDSFKKLIDYKRRECDMLGYKKSPYQAMIKEYEPDISLEKLDLIFEDIKEKILLQIKEKSNIKTKDITDIYDLQKQKEFGLFISEKLGYNINAGRHDISPHPFTAGITSQDARITTRINQNNFLDMFWGMIHEAGHALYYQGMKTENYGLPSGEILSFGINESQSRFWENNIAKSKNFWIRCIKIAKDFFPKQLENISAEDIYCLVNQQNISSLRSKSDEITYHLHILIRYEIEKDLIESKIEVDDLREVWNQKYKKYLNLEIKDDNDGILQDVHRYTGAFGYFPTYSLGSFYAAQFENQIRKDIKDFDKKIQKGEFLDIRNWLGEKIHQHGRIYSADELCNNITGETLNIQYFLDYISEKK